MANATKNPGGIRPTPGGQFETADTIQQVTAAIPPEKLIADVQPDGGIQVHFLIEPADAARLMRRAQTMPLSRYIWENIVRRAVQDHIY